MIENTQKFENNVGEDDQTKFQRAYVNGKIGGVKVQAGRYNNKLAEGNVYDNRFDGVQVSYGKDVKLTAGYGKATASSASSVITNKFYADKVWYADLTGKVGKLGLGAGYYDFDYDQDNTTASIDDGMSIWQVNASYAFDKNFKLGAMYLKGDDEFNGTKNIDDDGYVVTAQYKGAKASQAGSWGIVAKYYDQGDTTYVDHTMNGKADKMNGFKGYSVAANYAFAKNIVGQVEWYDLDAKADNAKDAQTIWSQLVFTF